MPEIVKPPRKPKSIARANLDKAPHVPGPAIVPKPVDPRQTELFRPAFIEPCKPVLRERLPKGPRWSYAIKHDGYRVQAHASRGEIRLFTKSGLDWTERMPSIRAAVAALERDLILDGEAVIVGDDGIPDFFALHAALANKHAPEAGLLAFDLLALDGEDLRRLPLQERRSKLHRILAQPFPALDFSEEVQGDPATLITRVCEIGFEGIVAKRIDQPYRSGDRDDWVKVRCTRREQFAVVGFDPAGLRGVSSLKLAKLVEGALVPCGAAGSGLDEKMSRGIRAALDAGHHVVVEIEHRGGTPSGGLRHPVVRGWNAEP